ncbi:MAG: ribonuclease HII [Eubacteriales bacterium]
MSIASKDRAICEKLMAFDNMHRTVGQVIVGMDEAGRGPLAGAVVAAAVVLPETPLIIGVKDSKKLAEKKRERLFDEIIQNAVAYGVGVVDEKTIDEINILNAARLAFKRAYEQITIKTDVVLSDYIAGLDISGYVPIVKGDSQSYAIAAASIIAKVTRDRMMREYAKEFPVYGFDSHKGYGSSAHIQAIKTYGACEIHRKTFLTRILPTDG